LDYRNVSKCRKEITIVGLGIDERIILKRIVLKLHLGVWTQERNRWKAPVNTATT
jgi:hypothetical protein